MPRIEIKEKDLTTAGELTSQDAVYVPGFANLDPEVQGEAPVEAFIPKLCATVDEFEAAFGKLPAYFAKGYPYDARFPEVAGTGPMFAIGQPDPSYVYAKELIQAGLPVVYERMNLTKEEVDADIMYDRLANADTWNNITDKNWYSEIKYITSGGYPTFECSDSTVTYVDVPSATVKHFEEDDFVEKIGRDAEEKRCNFIYALKVTPIDHVPTITDFAEDPEIIFVVTEGEFINNAYCLNSETMEVIDYTGIWKVWSLSINGSDFEEIAGSILDYGFTVIENPVPHATIEAVVPAKDSVNSAIANLMSSCAATRGDAIALIDHTNNPNRPLKGEQSVYGVLTGIDSKAAITKNPEYATMFTPWCEVNYVTKITDENHKAIPTAMPASFVYLQALAKSLKTNASWLAIAGVARGQAAIVRPNLAGGIRLTNAIADEYQNIEHGDKGISINPITYINPYGYLIWGNRTLRNNAEGLVATSFLSTRNLVSDVKKVAYTAAKKCLFEQNSDILWLKYKDLITPLLDKMVSGSGLSGYKLIKVATSEKAKLKCIIRLYPIYAVERFDITIELADNDEVSVS